MTPALTLLAAAMRAYDRVHAEQRCDTCGATWDAEEGEGCRWCADAEANQRRWQAELVLEPPDVDPDDITYDGAMTGWAERLAVAVQAGIVTKEQAHLAINRKAKAS